MITKEKTTTLHCTVHVTSCEAPCNMTVAKYTLQRRIKRIFFWGGKGLAELPSDGHKGDWVKGVQRGDALQCVEGGGERWDDAGPA